MARTSRIREWFFRITTESLYDRIISERNWVLKIMAHEVEQTRKPTNSFMILSNNDFDEFRSSQPGEISKMTLNYSLRPDMVSLKATKQSPEVIFALLQGEAKVTLERSES